MNWSGLYVILFVLVVTVVLLVVLFAKPRLDKKAEAELIAEVEDDRAEFEAIRSSLNVNLGIVTMAVARDLGPLSRKLGVRQIVCTVKLSDTVRFDITFSNKEDHAFVWLTTPEGSWTDGLFNFVFIMSKSLLADFLGDLDSGKPCDKVFDYYRPLAEEFSREFFSNFGKKSDTVSV